MSIKSILGSFVILGLFTLSACGQKGPLEHSEETKAEIAAEQAAQDAAREEAEKEAEEAVEETTK